MHKVECVIVGAGVIGLAIARALALAGREVVIVERERHFGMETSSRNSEVIHAGIYYPEGSLKARFCADGRNRLYEYCDSHRVPYRKCGKLVVATGGHELGMLEEIRLAAQANGVGDVDYVPDAQLRRDFPELVCVEALRSPSTGIIDSHQFMLSLLGDTEDAGAMVAYGTAVTAAIAGEHGIALSFDGAGEFALEAKWLINSAGLRAAALAACISGLDPTFVPRTSLAKGSYFTLGGRSPFSTLIYPVPTNGGLGIHLTIDMGGQTRFGPDVEWVDEIDYEIDPTRADRFYAAIRAYWPALPDGALQTAYAGIRPKLSGPGGPVSDFRIDGPEIHGVEGLINLFGIESPGLTASLAIADHVASLME